MNQVEERLDHVFRFALVQTQALKQQVSQFGFGEGRRFQRRQCHFKRAPWHLPDGAAGSRADRSTRSLRLSPSHQVPQGGANALLQ